MGNELEDALRAAAAVGKAKANGVTQTQTPVGQSPKRKQKRKANSRARRRSRSDSMASDFSGTNDDPVQRLEAFKARMFEVGKAAASATFTSTQPKVGDDIVKVQWKAKKLTGGQRAGEGDEEDAVPQLTRAKVAKSQPVSGGVVVTPLGNGAAKAGKKKNKKKKKTNVQVELKVPQPAQPEKTSTTKQPQVQQQKPARTAVKSVAVESVTLSASAHEDEDSSSASEDELPAAPAPVVTKPIATIAPDDLSSGSEDEALEALVSVPLPSAKTTPQVKKPAAVAKPAPKPTAKATASANATAKTVKPASTPVAKTPAVKKPVVKPTPPANPTPAPSAKPARARAASITNEDQWDLNSLVQSAVQKKKAISARKPSTSEDEQSDADGRGSEAGDFDGKEFKEHRMHLFSQLIDEAARDQWELVEVGRLVRIFAAQWSHKKKKTARFLRRYCPELVSVDFLEGLNINLEPKQLIAIFDRGSGSQGVLLNKVASAIENNNIHVQDDAFLKFITSKTDPMATNQEVLEFVVPLLESLSKVKDVGVLLKAICQHWQLERTSALVQDILLTPVFDDLDGQHDEILEDLPHLEGRIDFPSRMDAEDADENGNLKGLIAGDESDLGESDAHTEDEKEDELGEVLSEDAEGEDSHAEDGVYEGETDSEEEREARERLSPPKRRRSRFILDEAEEDDDEHEDEAMDGEEDDFLAEDEEESDDSSEDSDSEDDEASKPQRKRLRRG